MLQQKEWKGAIGWLEKYLKSANVLFATRQLDIGLIMLLVLVQIVVKLLIRKRNEEQKYGFTEAVT